jgi:hypothetical protein
MKPVAQCDDEELRGSIPSLALWPIIRHPFGFTQFVTSLRAKFCSGLVANLWPGRIARLICISLSWHTHGILPMDFGRRGFRESSALDANCRERCFRKAVARDDGGL